MRHASGVLIGRKYVLTAAHRVSDVTQKKKYSGCHVYPGKIGDRRFFGQSRVSRVHVHPLFSMARNEQERHRYDVAVLELKDPLGEGTGWPSFAVCDLLNLQKRTLEICGYNEKRALPY